MDTKDIRWLQRYESFHKAFQRIIQVTASDRKPAELSELEKEDHDGWRKMMKARNTTSHTCNEGEARSIVDAIYQDYAPLFDRLDKKLAVEVRQTHLEDV